MVATQHNTPLAPPASESPPDGLVNSEGWSWPWSLYKQVHLTFESLLRADYLLGVTGSTGKGRHLNVL